MASSDISTSSQLSVGAADDHKRTVDEGFLNRMKGLVERLRLENANLKKSLDVERSGVRAIKAQYEANIRYLKTEHRKKEETLEKQLRITNRNEKNNDDVHIDNKLPELKKLTTEIQFLKAANKGLHEKLKVAQAAEMARAAELRAQVAKHAAIEASGRKDSRAQCHKLLEEIKSKERVIIQLRREVSKANAQEYDQAQTVDCGRKFRVDQNKERSEVMEVQHRKTFHRELDRDSAVSSAPTSLSPHPPSDMWSCGQCKQSAERASAAARECTRLSDALRDARDQLELMEFRLLELEDASPEKGARDNLTDTDSGCVSPGSRIKDSASPELKRMDSGYKSPNSPSSPATVRRTSLNTPNSPCDIRRTCATPHDDYREEFAKAQVLADILDRSSDSDSLRSNPVKDHLEQMILNAASAEDRNCLEQVLMLLYNLQTLSSSVSEDECYQTKPKRISELKQQKSEPDIPLHKTQKAIATVTPYQQKGYKSESLESLCTEERKTTNSILQESGIFEGVETDVKGTQTDANEIFECTGELNTEIQLLNSIREKLEKQGVRNRTLGKDDSEGLECRCVKLGKKHKQYYERRLKFLEGKISIYEAAQDIKESKLAQRLQNEYLLENRIQELEFQLTDLQDKYERLEEECCELEEIENDTRLHWQQLELDYELCSAQLRDMTEQQKCTKAEAERLIKELANKECVLKNREAELSAKLKKLEQAVPALIAWNVVQAIGCGMPKSSEKQLVSRITPYSRNTKEFRCQVCCGDKPKYPVVEQSDDCNTVQQLQQQIHSLYNEKRKMEVETEKVKTELEKKVDSLQKDCENAKKQIEVLQVTAEMKKEQLEKKIRDLEDKVVAEKIEEEKPADLVQNALIKNLQNSEKALQLQIAELEKREKAYLEMLTQADDLWAEMEGGYKTKIEESQKIQTQLKGQINCLTDEKDRFKGCVENLRRKIKEVEESESCMRIALEKAERDTKNLGEKNSQLCESIKVAHEEVARSEAALRGLDARFKKESEDLRKVNKSLDEKITTFKEEAMRTERKQLNDIESIRKELHRMCKQNQDLEVTNCELKEEVESLEKQLSITQKSLAQCKRKCDEKVKTLSHELSIKTEELEELRCETMRQSLQASRIDLKPDKTEYVDEGYPIYTAVPKKTDYSRMHHSLSYISDSRCSCPSMRSQLVGQLIEDLFDRMHSASDEDLSRLCKDMPVNGKDVNPETKAKITNYLLMAISKELVRSIGDADAKTDTEEWQRSVSSMTYNGSLVGGVRRGAFSSLLEGNAGVVAGAARLASVSCACAAARLCTNAPQLADTVKICQEEVLDHGDVKIMEEQLANAIESIVNCPSCALGTNAIVWSTDV